MNYFEKINNIIFESPSDGTFLFETMRSVKQKKGYQVTFQQRNSAAYTEEFYNRLVRFLKDYTGSPVYLGIYKKEAEVSFYTESELIALDVAREFHQESYYDWEAEDTVEEAYYERRRRKL